MRAIVLGTLTLLVVAVGWLFPLYWKFPRRGGVFYPEWSQGVRYSGWVASSGDREAIGDYFTALAALEVSDNMPAEEIRSLVARVILERRGGRSAPPPRLDDVLYRERMVLLGDRAVPFLLELLRDPELHTLSYGSDGDVLRDSPFGRVCNFLEESAPAEAVPLLIPFVTHDEEHFRASAGLLLGKIATDATIAPVIALLADPSPRVRRAVVMGIQRGVAAGGRSTMVLDTIFPALERLLRDPDDGSCDVAMTLLQVRRDRAIEVLLSEEYFTVDNPGLSCILDALTQASIVIDHETLRPLLATLMPLASEHPQSRVLAQALLAYSRNPDDKCEALLKGFITADSRSVREAACEALGFLNGLQHPWRFVDEIMTESGFEVLTGPQRHVAAAATYHMITRNDGHYQYFQCSWGDHFQHAIAGLEAVGAHRRAAILREAGALFPLGRVPEGLEERGEKLAAFSDAQRSSLSALDSRYHSEETEEVRGLIYLYALENLSHFTRE